MHDLIEAGYRMIRDIHAARLPPAAREELLLIALNLLLKMDDTKAQIADEEQEAAARLPREPNPDGDSQQTNEELLKILRSRVRPPLN